jgi:hypothetical protein
MIVSPFPELTMNESRSLNRFETLKKLRLEFNKWSLRKASTAALGKE